MNPTSSISTEKWAAIAAVTAGALALIKKCIPRGASRNGPHDSGRIDAIYLALVDKMELQHNQVLTKLDCQGENFERRLDRVESCLARLDERTQLH